jgi:hypothetical protein
MQPVLVRWLDIVVENGWTDITTAVTHRPDAVETLGFIVYEDADRLVLAQSVSGHQVNPYTVIPTGCIASVTKLEIPK